MKIIVELEGGVITDIQVNEEAKNLAILVLDYDSTDLDELISAEEIEEFKNEEIFTSISTTNSGGLRR